MSYSFNIFGSAAFCGVLLRPAGFRQTVINGVN